MKLVVNDQNNLENEEEVCGACSAVRKASHLLFITLIQPLIEKSIHFS